MLNLTWIGLFIPLLGFLILLTCANRIDRRLTNLIACSTVLISFISFVILLIGYTYFGMTPQRLFLYPWIRFDGISADFSLELDPLSLVMTLIITGVGFLIHVYSTGYMDHEEDFARFFACMNFFIFAMLLLVLASNLLLLFVGWEGVGLASYLLIGFWYQKPAAARAATKAFVVNRVGDWGLLVGLLLTFYLFGTSEITEISVRAIHDYPVGTPIILVLTLLYFMGAIGKSAQIPLHVWLPDAMEGPTPVSALIHAATMVTAGVYLVVRLHAIFILSPHTLHTVGLIGGVTSFVAALCAIGQTDLKRVLAYSTVSQLGVMFLACGVGAFYAAMFHLTTHAFMKALLFLAAGNVVHMMQGTTDMQKMGGLSQIFTKTSWLFLIGVLSMSGVPPLAAFFSKDLILEQEHLSGFEVLFYAGLITSILTAFYLTRAYCLTFTGSSRVPAALLKTIKEAPNVMLVPVSVLGLLTIVGGFLGFCFNCKTPLLEGFLAQIGITLIDEEPSGLFIFTREALISITGALLGIGAAYVIYTQMKNRLGPDLPTLKNGFFVDSLYNRIFVRPLKAISDFIADFLEPKVFEGSINGTAHRTQTIARELQRIQSGEIRSYAAWMVLGSAILLVWIMGK